MERMQGFTLIEVMIVVAIIAILAAIAVPSYNSSRCKTDLRTVQGDLMDIAQGLERFHTANNFSYEDATISQTGADGNDVGLSFSPSAGGFNKRRYTVSIAAQTATTFTLRATPLVNDCSNGLIELDANGARRLDKNNDADFTDTNEDNWD